MKKQTRTKSERVALLTLKKAKVETTLSKTNKEAERLKTRIIKRELEGLSTKFLQNILSEKHKATRSLRSKLKSINQELIILQSPWNWWAFSLSLKIFTKTILSQNI